MYYDSSGRYPYDGVRLSAAIPPGLINWITFCFALVRDADLRPLRYIHPRCGIFAAILNAVDKDCNIC